jgi:hypothetical protein
MVMTSLHRPLTNACATSLRGLRPFPAGVCKLRAFDGVNGGAGKNGAYGSSDPRETRRRAAIAPAPEGGANPSFHGQGIAWDRSSCGDLYGIIRATNEEEAAGVVNKVTVSRVRR